MRGILWDLLVGFNFSPGWLLMIERHRPPHLGGDEGGEDVDDR